MCDIVRRLASIRFLVFRFRPDVWYFGLVLLARGPLLSLPGVIATNMPSLHLAARKSPSYSLMHMSCLISTKLTHHRFKLWSGSEDHTSKAAHPDAHDFAWIVWPSSVVLALEISHPELGRRSLSVTPRDAIGPLAGIC